MSFDQPTVWNDEETLSLLSRLRTALRRTLDSEPPAAVAESLRHALEEVDAAIATARLHTSSVIVPLSEAPALKNCDLLRGVVAYPGTAS